MRETMRGLWATDNIHIWMLLNHFTTYMHTYKQTHKPQSLLLVGPLENKLHTICTNRHNKKLTAKREHSFIFIYLFFCQDLIFFKF